MEYSIQPVKVKGKIKSFDRVEENRIKIHLSGRLGVLVIPKTLIVNYEDFDRNRYLTFYYSYLRVQDMPFDNDVSELLNQKTIEPCVVSGVLTEVNDTAVECKMNRDLGAIRVPRRTVITEVPLKEGLPVEFYLSKALVVAE
ncbi:Uncharacterised protein [Aedoeadaptatus ivorii]|uniref:Uncharacterized protein n=1 Tax=Aedoeadaptatus ivorii TaxID=54006 RepID=A0A448V088_9FIRM|nr:CBO2463/CBO2479 domain-containing protein [Peptoniphilus ivorii]MDQ0507985.1 hypothetical protein [Peptoniphilus ivorii]VEJ34831.1 Uncharacterised protein [Peptoniphilus ivorii]